MGMHMIWWMTLAGCGGAKTTAPAPAAVPAQADSAQVQAAVAGIQGRLPEFERVEVPPTSEGDLTRITVGHRDGDAWVWVTDEWSMGDYGTSVNTYALQDGALISWVRTGHEWSPTDDQDNRFVYFEEQVLYGSGLSVLLAQRRELVLDGSGEAPDLSQSPWMPLPRLDEAPDLAEVLATLDAARP